jgi:folate-dependent phosphoribosylglycinamide formyltransferase PurN
MKLVLVTQDAPVYLHTFLEGFLDGLGNTDHEVVGIVVFSAFVERGPVAEVVFRLRYYGLTDFVRMGLLIVGNRLRSLTYRPGKGRKCASVANVVQKFGLHVIEAPTPNDKGFLRRLGECEADVVVSIASPKIFGKKLLATPRFGCVNFHMGYLPRYRGLAPLFWALLNGEKEMAMTVHEMDAELDNGPILAQRVEPITPSDSVHSLFERGVHLGPGVLLQAIERIASGSPERIENDAAKSSYFGYPKIADGQRLRRLGRRFF